MGRLISKKIILVMGVILLSGVIFIYENCSNAKLSRPIDQTSLTNHSLSGTFCASLPSATTAYHVTNFAIINLTAKMVNGQLMADSDMDGLTDDEEAALDFNPVVRRTNSNVLDKICVQLAGGSSQCRTLNISCDGKTNGLGLSSCDIAALNLDTTQPSPGIDSDQDGMVDIVEILKGTLPNRIDSDEDPDGDGVLNRIELARGTNPNQPDADTPSQYLNIYTSNQIADASICGSETWGFSATQIPTIKVKAFSDPLDPYLSHAVDENVFLIVYKSIPPQTTTGNFAEVWGHILKVGPNGPIQSILAPSDFKLFGKVKP